MKDLLKNVLYNFCILCVGGVEGQSNKVPSPGDKSVASEKSTKSKFRTSLKSSVVRLDGETRLEGGGGSIV